MKKKIFGITLAVCLIVLSIASTTMAYFTDTDTKTNVFTAGKVDIKFTQETIFEDGNVYPGKQIGSAAKVENVGTETAYAGIIITITTKLPNNVDLTEGDIAALFDITNFKYSKTTNESGVTTVSVYVVNTAVLTTTGDTKTTTFYEKIAVPYSWDNTKMGMFNNLSISVTAYATQSVGFDNAETALTTAFVDNGWGDAYTAATAFTAN